MLVRQLCASVALVVLVATTTAAQEPAGQDDEARALFDAGRIAFEAGRYDAALESFRRAHELSGRPELLYNIGQAADRLRLDEQALEAFEAFIAAVPDHPTRTAVDARIAVLRSQIASGRESESGGPGAVPAVLAIAGGAVAVAGGVLLGLALADRAELESLDEPQPWPELESRYERVPLFSTLGIVGLAVGGATALAGIAWMIASPAEGEQPVRARLGPQSVTVEGSF